MNKKQHGPPKAFVDLHRLPEDERIVIIGDYCLLHPDEKVGVPVDDEPGKLERYKQKIETKYPQLKVEIVRPFFMKNVALLHVTTHPQG